MTVASDLGGAPTYLRSMHRPDRALIVDGSAASEPLAEAEFRSWAREQRVFVSSVMEELREERRAVAERIDTTGAEPVLFERFGGREDDAEQAYLHEVATSSIYLGILGGRYGRRCRRASPRRTPSTWRQNDSGSGSPSGRRTSMTVRATPPRSSRRCGRSTPRHLPDG